MKTSVFGSFLLIIVLLTGCSYPHYYYSPNSQSVPLFNAKNDFSADVAGSIGAVNGALEIQSGISLPAHIALTASYMTGGNKHEFSNVTDLSKLNYFEGAGGFYTSFSGKGVFEVYGGFGRGSQHHVFAFREYSAPLDWNWISDGKADLTFSKFFVQPDVGFKLDWIEGAFSCRLTKLNFTDIDFRYTTYRIDDMNSLMSNTAPWFIEPAFTLRGGQKSVKFQLQVLTSRSLSGSYELFESFRFGFGLHINIAGKQLVNTGQSE